MVTRDPEFDDVDLERLLAYQEYRRGVCECGIHESLASDKSNVFTFERRVCSVCKGTAQYGRVLAAEDEATAEKLKDMPPATQRPSDGRRLYVKQLSALEVATRRASRAPTEPPA